MEAAPALGEPLPEPAPVPDCVQCARLADERERWRAAGDDTRVSDCNVWMRRHPTHEHRVPW
ncbi:hypothetical protein [Streptomyces fungicidicus]|uniref:hypothetical protein n=1 Tax=Streptomyces fungicidicus TaxID=68203 RepID=UPI003D738932